MPPHASHYSPKYTPGARLPHAWVEVLRRGLIKGIIPADLSYVFELSIDAVNARRWSTLDLCRFDSMTLIQADTPAAKQRAAELTELVASDHRLRRPSNPAVMTSQPLIPAEQTMAQSSILRVVTHGVDFQVIPGSAGETFVNRARLTSSLGGGVLVRPDQHIVLMVGKETAAQEIFNAIRMHLFGGVSEGTQW